MHRNLDRRVETLIRLTDDAQVDGLVALIDHSMDSTTSSWHLGADGTWTRHHLTVDGEPLSDHQEVLISRQRRRLSLGR
jgi:polyphosphate kinase